MVRLLVYLAVCCTTWQRSVSIILDSLIDIEEIDCFVLMDLPLLCLP